MILERSNNSQPASKHNGGFYRTHELVHFFFAITHNRSSSSRTPSMVKIVFLSPFCWLPESVCNDIVQWTLAKAKAH